MTLIPWAVTGGEDTQTPVCDGGGTLHKHRRENITQTSVYSGTSRKPRQASTGGIGQTHLRRQTHPLCPRSSACSIHVPR